jgi:hypothetical protein
MQMYFEDLDTHDDFEIEVDEWIVENSEENGWKEYPVVWPGLETPQGCSLH